ncbi:MAG: GNAT family N-acetyltransferase, partial [Ensifer adhaerens]
TMPSIPLMYAIAAAKPKRMTAAPAGSRPEMVIRPYRAEDRDRLMAIWLSASRVGHPFLGEERLLAQLQMIRDTYLPMADNWVAEVDGRPAGFIGLIGNFVGGLFVDPEIHGAGIGRGLIEHAAARLRCLEVSVDADNPSAVEFYRRRGFVETDRQETDDEGLPFAVIHMTRAS